MVNLDNLPNLQLILTAGIRNYSLDIDACKAAGVAVGVRPSYSPFSALGD